MELFNYKFDDLFEPTVKSLQILGGSGSVQEIEETVINLLNLSDEKITAMHKGNITQLAYQLAWARDYLKQANYIEQSQQGIWSLTKLGNNSKYVDKDEVKSLVKSSGKGLEYHDELDIEINDDANIEINELNWQEKVLQVVKSISPEKFEKLCQRLLRELGFINVEVTGKVADGGIDGKGVFRIGGVMSFHVVFQCKRYSGSVPSSTVRDFRGAFVGRADKGLIITTGTFTRDAKKEAQRDGASPIDLIDGLELAEKLKELKLGIQVDIVERVNVNTDWFNNF